MNRLNKENSTKSLDDSTSGDFSNGGLSNKSGEVHTLPDCKVGEECSVRVSDFFPGEKFYTRLQVKGPDYIMCELKPNPDGLNMLYYKPLKHGELEFCLNINGQFRSRLNPSNLRAIRFRLNVTQNPGYEQKPTQQASPSVKPVKNVQITVSPNINSETSIKTVQHPSVQLLKWNMSEGNDWKQLANIAWPLKDYIILEYTISPNNAPVELFVEQRKDFTFWLKVIPMAPGRFDLSLQVNCQAKSGAIERHCFPIKLDIVPDSEPRSSIPPKDIDLGENAPKISGVPQQPIIYPARYLPNCKMAEKYNSMPLAEILAPLQAARIDKITVTSKNVNNPKCRIERPDDGSCHLFCEPAEAGEFELELKVDACSRNSGTSSDIQQHIFPLKLVVIADPKTLWKNIPSPQGGIYAKPDSDKKIVDCGAVGLTLLAASQRGRSHAQEGKPRDDDFACIFDAENKCVIMAVADGAGSAKFSRKGSLIAVHAACSIVQEKATADYWASLEPTIHKWKSEADQETRDKLEQNIGSGLYKVLISAAFEAKTRIRQEAEAHEKKFMADYGKSEKFVSRDYATTLILTVAKKFEFGWFIATYWIGDGGVGIYQPDLSRVILHGTPDSGEFGGQTRFLTDDGDNVWPNDSKVLIKRRIRFDLVDSFKAIVLMTDGISDPKFETERNLNSITSWNSLWSDLEASVPLGTRKINVADSLLSWMDFWSPGNHDDRTMMILY